jgi:glycosyltransferase involved in cell wall biosynthesis
MDHLADAAGRENVPRVSIVLPAYNGARTIGITLEALAVQDFPSVEWIVVDDASRDGTPGIVGEFFENRLPDGKLMRHASNQGLSRTLNEGLAAARGELVLIVHQDVAPTMTDWIRRAVRYLDEDENIAVVTCYYGVPAPDDLTFVKRAFGFLRRQFHRPPPREREFVTFTEFKCDLVRKSVLTRVGGFPTQFRITGEDIVVSYRIRKEGGRILKAYDLRTVQRFSGKAETVLGNLDKEFRFGQSMGGVLLAFRGFSLRGLSDSPYARTRSLHRASQPLVALAVTVLAVTALVTGSWLVWLLLGGLFVGRYAYYVSRLWADFRSAVPRATKAFVETLAASFLGLLSDFVYSLGLSGGIVRGAVGAPL